MSSAINEVGSWRTSIRPFLGPGVKPKFCADYGNLATQEALFRVDEIATVIEKYCDRCIKNVK